MQAQTMDAEALCPAEATTKRHYMSLERFITVLATAVQDVNQRRGAKWVNGALFVSCNGNVIRNFEFSQKSLGRSAGRNRRLADPIQSTFSRRDHDDASESRGVQCRGMWNGGAGKGKVFDRWTLCEGQRSG